ncbi:DUF3888 domain-containing protein [Fredinandcohnia sp. 179-A 10B2 NHS]|uniref:DUF3888 domain-containing protein n=1 Tax=Fredinandcohnia sp. 179-A 10B2 NHS TaxID=3235176 RepID=UPI00399F143E
MLVLIGVFSFFISGEDNPKTESIETSTEESAKGDQDQRNQLILDLLATDIQKAINQQYNFDEEHSASYNVKAFEVTERTEEGYEGYYVNVHVEVKDQDETNTLGNDSIKFSVKVSEGMQISLVMYYKNM